jgi:hypothetical protein
MILTRPREKFLKKKSNKIWPAAKIKILVVLLGQRYLMLCHGHKKIRQEKGEEEKQKVTFASLSLSLLQTPARKAGVFFGAGASSDFKMWAG